MTTGSPVRHAVWFAMIALLGGCQFEDRCGKDPLIYKGGLCFPRDAGVDKDSGSDEGDEEDSGTDEDGGTGSAAENCKAACDLIGACLADGDFGSFLAPQLEMIGFEGTDRSGCVTHCEEHSAGAGDGDALGCIADAESKAMCSGADIADSVDATNTCCEGRADSEYCVELCNALKGQELAYAMVKVTCDEVLQ